MLFVYSSQLVVTANSVITKPALTLWPHFKIHCQSSVACYPVEDRTLYYRALCTLILQLLT
jgi:hypothetical protein